jgi:hypothetical protein
MSAQIVVSMTGVSEEVAKKTLEENGGDVIAAVDALSKPPTISGTRYIPAPPKIDDGLTDEVRDNLKKARQFSDILSASPQNDLRGKVVSPPPSGDGDSAKAPSKTTMFATR